MLYDFLVHTYESLGKAAWAVMLPTPFFLLIGLCVKRRKFMTDVMRSLKQSRINLMIHFTDAVLVAPIVGLLIYVMGKIFRENGLILVPQHIWDGMPYAVAGFAAVFVADFAGYWRHRVEHTPLLWPSHAVHHSDDEMTWLAIFRFHPINRLTTAAMDFAILLLLGLPEYALMVAVFIKHFYGAYIHADLPWTYGPLSRIFVSPAMHRWHHAADPKAYNTNYATVFSLFDWVFGTYRVPGVCDVKLGVPQNMGEGFVGQMTYPLKPSSYRYFVRRLQRFVPREMRRDAAVD